MDLITVQHELVPPLNCSRNAKTKNIFYNSPKLRTTKRQPISFKRLTTQ